MRIIATTIALAGLMSSAAIAATPQGPEGCFNSAVRPGTITITCGDGNFSFRSIRWRSWSRSRASGSATAWVNDCNPYCAAGHVGRYHARLLLSRPARCRDGTLLFRRLRWTFTASKPSGEPRRDQMRVTCGMAGHR